MSDFHFVTGTGASTTLLASPIADALAGTIYTDVVSMAQYEEVYFLLSWGVGASGTTGITVEACDNFTPSNTDAIAFYYKRVSSGETNTAWTAATTSGFTTTAGSHQAYIIRAQAQDLPSVSNVVYENVRLACVEDTNSPILAGCLIMMAKPRYNEATLDAVTS